MGIVASTVNIGRRQTLGALSRRLQCSRRRSNAIKDRSRSNFPPRFPRSLSTEFISSRCSRSPFDHAITLSGSFSCNFTVQDCEKVLPIHLDRASHRRKFSSNETNRPSNYRGHPRFKGTSCFLFVLPYVKRKIYRPSILSRLKITYVHINLHFVAV